MSAGPEPDAGRGPNGSISGTPSAEGLSALPSTTARALAFVAICICGLAGALIGYALVDLQCSGDCDAALGVGVLVGAVLSAGGAAIVAVLVLRALGEWREISDRAR